jgi:hypothetical protein
MENLNCVFSEPVDFQRNIPLTKQDFWNFSKMTCFSSSTELIENSENGSEFYLSKTINYGDILVLTFLLLFAIFGIVKLIGDFFIPQRVDIRKP